MGPDGEAIGRLSRRALRELLHENAVSIASVREDGIATIDSTSLRARCRGDERAGRP
jgi:hypothetical protein